VILFHPYDNWGYQSMSPATDQFYLEYVIARFASYRNIWWSLANEYDLMEDKEMEDWHNFFKIIRENDPYKHMAGIHNCIDFYDNSQPYVSHGSVQSSKLQKARLWREQYKKPIIFDECRYEGNIGFHFGNQSAQEMTSKFWQGTVAGCYVGHGETYKHPENILWWSKGGILHGESPARIAFLKKILEEAPIDGIEPIDAWSGGKPGEYYLHYFGNEALDSWKLNLPENVKFQVEIIDTWKMTIRKLDGTFSGNCEVELPGEKYTALRISKVGYYYPIDPVMVQPSGGLFYPDEEVKLLNSNNDGEIRYTIDGTTPNHDSNLYNTPIPVSEKTTIMAVY
jgi:hypothetical protein